MIGDPPDGALDRVKGPFRRLQYIDYRKPSKDALEKIVQALREDPPRRPRARGRTIISKLRDCNESERADALELMHTSRTLDLSALSARLRHEIRENFWSTAPKFERRSKGQRDDNGACGSCCAATRSNAPCIPR